MGELISIRDKLRDFASERDWDKFHSPKNLAMALVGEAGELLAELQWLSQEESASPDAERRRAIEYEAADVLIYLVRFADKLDIDLVAAVEAKMAINDAKYPAHRVHGSSKKYTEYE